MLKYTAANCSVSMILNFKYIGGIIHFQEKNFQSTWGGLNANGPQRLVHMNVW